MNSVGKFIAFIDGTSLRERILLVAVVTLVLTLGSYQFLLEPIQRHTRQLNQQLADTQKRQNDVVAETQLLSSNDANNPGSSLRRRLARAQSELAAVNAALSASGRQFLDDRQLSAWLAHLLNSPAGRELRVIALQSLPAEQVYPAPGAKNDDKSSPALYRKGVELRFLGTYAATQRYFEALQHSSWPVQWGDLDYQVKTYPLGETRVVVYTYILGPDADTMPAAPSPGGDRREKTLERISALIDPAFAAGQKRQEAAVAAAGSQLSEAQP